MGPRGRTALVLLLALGTLPAPGSGRPLRESEPDRRPPRAPDAAAAPAPLPAVPRARPVRRASPRDVVLVRFRDDVSDERRARAAVAAGGARYRASAVAPFGRIALAPGADADAVVAALRANPEVAWAERDVPCYTAARGRPLPASFADPLLPRQWPWERIGLLAAFDRNGRLGEGVIVAVVDTGIAYGSGTTFPARPGVDLAGARFVPGWDFVDDDPLAYDLGSTIDDAEPFTAPRFGHGTFAAAEIAAVAGNGVAGIGVAPRAVLMPLRVLDVDGSGLFSDIAEAIEFAVANGAKVINMSLGGPEGSSAVAEAARRATAAGVVLVAAAGNEALDGPDDVAFPARYPEVIAVGATNYAGEVAQYSNRGPSLDLVAPAGDGLEELPGGLRDGALSTSFVHDPLTGDTLYGPFWSTGTSFAAPQVAGAAALLMSLGVTDPEGVRILLEATAADLGPVGFDTASGHGRLDVLNAHRGVGLSE